MNTLYVGIDVSSKSNVVYLMLPNGDKHSNFSVANSHKGSTQLVKRILSALTSHSLDTVLIGLKSTSVYGDNRYKALQNLTRARFFAVQNLTKEKQRFINVLFKKYSAMTQEKVFSKTFGTTALAVYDEFESEVTRLIPSGNRFLKYYLYEAAFSLVRCDKEYSDFYHLKYKEVNRYQHKHALALTARKFVRLFFRLLKDNRLYRAAE